MQPDADHLAEGNQTFAIRLYESPVGEGFGIPPLATAQFTIVDDDSALAGDQRFHLIGAGAFRMVRASCACSRAAA